LHNFWVLGLPARISGLEQLKFFVNFLQDVQHASRKQSTKVILRYQ
jgi:hypothetical protein